MKQLSMNDLGDVNNALKEICELERKIESVNWAQQQKLNTIKEAAQKEAEPLQLKLAEISGKIEAFAQERKDELFGVKRSQKLSFGTIGFRETTSIEVSPETAELLEKYKLDKYVKVTVTKTPVKNLMRELNDKTLSKVSASKIVKDSFFLTTKREDEPQSDLKAAS